MDTSEYPTHLKDVNNGSIISVQLQNMYGELLVHQKNQSNNVLNTSGFTNGLYLLMLIDDKGQSMTKKIMISH